MINSVRYLLKILIVPKNCFLLKIRHFNESPSKKRLLFDVRMETYELASVKKNKQILKKTLLYPIKPDGRHHQTLNGSPW